MYDARPINAKAVIQIKADFKNFIETMNTKNQSEWKEFKILKRRFILADLRQPAELEKIDLNLSAQIHLR